MSVNPPPPPPGQPDPHQQGWGAPPPMGQPSGPPASPAPYGGVPGQPPPAVDPYAAFPPTMGQPPVGPPTSGQPITGQPYPGPTPTQSYPAQPAYGAPLGPPQPAKKSQTGLIVGLAVGVLVLLLAVGGLGIALLVSSGDDDDPKVATGPTPTATGETPSTAPTTQPTEPGGDPNNAVTARYASDFDTVCQGGSIINAADYTPGGGTKAYAFSERPGSSTSRWTQRTISSSEPYYAKSDQFETVSVVGCMNYVEGSEGPGLKCDYQDRSKKKITVSYISSRYQLSFHAAKTGAKVGDGGTINAPATRCPSFITYDRATMKSYAAPDSGAVAAAFKKFLG